MFNYLFKTKAKKSNELDKKKFYCIGKLCLLNAQGKFISEEENLNIAMNIISCPIPRNSEQEVEHIIKIGKLNYRSINGEIPLEDVNKEIRNYFNNKY